MAWKPPEIRVLALTDGKLTIEVYCMACGGWSMRLPDDPTDMSMAHCAACGGWLGRLAAIKLKAAMMAKADGLISLEQLLKIRDRLPKAEPRKPTRTPQP
jgi:hypothetical protein